jgi:hypothetical protein
MLAFEWAGALQSHHLAKYSQMPPLFSTSGTVCTAAAAAPIFVLAAAADNERF